MCIVSLPSSGYPIVETMTSEICLPSRCLAVVIYATGICDLHLSLFFFFVATKHICVALMFPRSVRFVHGLDSYSDCFGFSQFFPTTSGTVS
jgi:hypothetical protein